MRRGIVRSVGCTCHPCWLASVRRWPPTPRRSALDFPPASKGMGTGGRPRLGTTNRSGRLDGRRRHANARIQLCTSDNTSETEAMKIPYLIVDGSNIATEGRSLPSLRQLDEAVRAFLDENDVGNLTVIVDATFGHRIAKDEVSEFDAAISNNEITTPPAGVIGRGDAFILQVADKAGATILSNDSYQEFHPQYRWLFDEGRLIGGKPVPGIGWVFTPRVPVRGPVSRKAMKAAKAPKAAEAKVPSRSRKRGGRGKDDGKGEGKATRKGTRNKSAASEPKPKAMKDAPVHTLNEPLAFIQFVAEHPVGSTVAAEVQQFSSHGAYVTVSGARCYVPLKALGDPAPRRARDVLRIGETLDFIVEAIDTPRRGIDLSLAREQQVRSTHERAILSDVLEDGFAHGGTRVTGKGQDVAALPDAVEDSSAEAQPGSTSSRPRTRKANTEAPVAVTKDGANHPAQEAPVTPVKKAAKKSAKKAAKKSARKSPARKAAKKAAKRTTKKAAKKRAKKAAKKSTKKAAKKAAKKSTRKAAKKSAKRAAKKSARKR
ncbi:MAG: S1 RNA-binding domain-containing protein [Actinobacteria bacterium]|nr:S1 RNA-binding domain-containing protein [Actinomycetota bacterium]